MIIIIIVKVKVKHSLYRTGQALRVSAGQGSQIYRHSHKNVVKL
jgi:hypothetical protein